MPNDNKDDLNMVLGGEEISATKRDGTQERVRVRELTISELPKYAPIIDDEAKSVELFCGKEPGWSDALTRDSIEALIGVGERVNFTFYSRWLERRLNRSRKILPGFDEKLMKMATDAAMSASVVSASSQPQS